MPAEDACILSVEHSARSLLNNAAPTHWRTANSAETQPGEWLAGAAGKSQMVSGLPKGLLYYQTGPPHIAAMVADRARTWSGS
jgi:hypothetical protein